MTRRIVTFRANSVGGRRVPALEIVATRPAPRFDSIEKAKEWQETEGRRIADALIECLPYHVVKSVLERLEQP